MTAFESPLLAGWVYPCSVDDLRVRMSELPREDVEGLHAVGLVPATRRDHFANARYFAAPRPVIHIYSFPSAYTMLLPRSVSRQALHAALSVEIRYGMDLTRDGARWACSWNPTDLRRFVLRYVVAHEVGHHVLHRLRESASLSGRAPGHTGEQFAHAYAARHE